MARWEDRQVSSTQPVTPIWINTKRDYKSIIGGLNGPTPLEGTKKQKNNEWNNQLIEESARQSGSMVKDCSHDTEALI